MLDELSHETAARRLQLAADNPQLSTGARRLAQELAERLTRGVRIVFLGPSRVGKSALCDAILGNFKEESTLEKTRFFEPDLRVPGNASIAIPNDAHQVVPSIVGKARFIDVAVPEEDAAFEACITQHLTRADIVVWCTQQFNAREAKLWQEASDSLKDHSFLVLTKADVLAARVELKDRMEALQQVVSEEFHSFFPVTTNRQRALQKAGKDVPEAVLTASGVWALVDTMASLVRSGQRADIDSAALFLERQGLNLDEPFTPAKTTKKLAPQSQKPPTQVQQACKSASDRLVTRAFDLAELGFDEPDGEMSEVLDLCGSISEDLVEDMRLLSEQEPEFDEWHSAFEEASDKIMLMNMENETRSAADAVTILLQLKRDLNHLYFQ